MKCSYLVLPYVMMSYLIRASYFTVHEHGVCNVVAVDPERRTVPVMHGEWRRESLAFNADADSSPQHCLPSRRCPSRSDAGKVMQSPTSWPPSDGSAHSFIHSSIFPLTDPSIGVINSSNHPSISSASSIHPTVLAIHPSIHPWVAHSFPPPCLISD